MFHDESPKRDAVKQVETERQATDKGKSVARSAGAGDRPEVDEGTVTFLVHEEEDQNPRRPDGDGELELSDNLAASRRETPT